MHPDGVVSVVDVRLKGTQDSPDFKNLESSPSWHQALVFSPSFFSYEQAS